jgi:hypothetical protein
MVSKNPHERKRNGRRKERSNVMNERRPPASRQPCGLKRHEEDGRRQIRAIM